MADFLADFFAARRGAFLTDFFDDFRADDFLREDFFAADFLREDFLAEDFFAEDFLAEDFFADDFFADDFFFADPFLLPAVPPELRAADVRTAGRDSLIIPVSGSFIQPLSP